ncbi:TPA: glycoside hydrolase family 19 protein, partial [Enterobacter hormaechei subsp. xiangfangensis]|nr:glycoside hydrolase family 19 protein [Enterobacter hormaechei subsp. xiangfangensis]
LDQAMFIAQMGHESTRFTRLVENLNYAAENLVPTFGSHRITQQQADALGRTATQPANQKAIANLVYGGEWGKEHLGNQVAGDGWKYRGRGLKQITGLSNYRNCGHALKLDLVTQPELLEQDEYAARSAAWFYVSHGCLLHSGDVERVTLLINGGRNGLDKRRALFNLAKSVLV